MSVILMGMDMPESCASCRMAVCFLDTGRAKCYATLSYIDHERGKRSYDCPLRPLPDKHGKLIDSTVFETFVQNLWEQNGISNESWVTFREWIRDQTIIEAEGGSDV